MIWQPPYIQPGIDILYYNISYFLKINNNGSWWAKEYPYTDKEVIKTYLHVLLGQSAIIRIKHSVNWYRKTKNLSFLTETDNSHSKKAIAQPVIYIIMLYLLSVGVRVGLGLRVLIWVGVGHQYFINGSSMRAVCLGFGLGTILIIYCGPH